MKNIGDIFERDGKKYQVTYVNGENYSYAPYTPSEVTEEHKDIKRRPRTRKA